ncbi:hypothetical protein WJX84_011106 [Apatococcus fuscideae]|uniref:A-kinase anchor protein 7-like phosphoesterase domain-containing protein n=1 Tax=Apatococcus fuscideae TaxID=2026836 RepID=A0AAW1RRA8_9CHLO
MSGLQHFLTWNGLRYLDLQSHRRSKHLCLHNSTRPLDPEHGKAGQGADQGQAQSSRRGRAPAPRPTHFLAFQLSQHEEVCRAIQRVQSTITAHNDLLRATLVDSEAAHLTLMVAELATTDLDGCPRLEKAIQAMDHLPIKLASQGRLRPVSLHLSGLSSFGTKVLYLDLTPGEDLEALNDLVKAICDHMDEAGIESTDQRGFTPHVTIAKMSRVKPRGRKPACKGIPKEAWKELAEVQCAAVEVAQLQLPYVTGRITGPEACQAALL